MKATTILNNLINILFWGMILISLIGFILFIILIFYGELLPDIFQNFRMIFSSTFPKEMFIVPFSNVLGFLLFIVSIYYLKKCIKPLENQRFYSDEVILNLKKTGRLFITIAIVTSIIRIIGLFVFNDLMNNMILGSSLGFWPIISGTISAVGSFYFSLLIIGLFLLVFSEAFKTGKLLKQENDLTI